MNNNHNITISEDDLFDLTEGDDISITGWGSSLTTSLSGGHTYSIGPATTTANTGAVGATLSTTNTGSLLWNNPTYTATASPYSVNTGTISATNWTTYNNQSQVLKVSGNAEFEGDIKIKGVSLDDRLNAIEERLGILRPNNDLEGKWEKLKKLGEEYRKLEKEILEGENIWDMLKK